MNTGYLGIYRVPQTIDAPGCAVSKEDDWRDEEQLPCPTSSGAGWKIFEKYWTAECKHFFLILSYAF
jgi:hypothetical protein